jgi:hypothetical protein
VLLCVLHVQEKWEEGYYITAMAGSMSSASLVVMSKGTPYTQQSYKVGGAMGWNGMVRCQLAHDVMSCAVCFEVAAMRLLDRCAISACKNSSWCL